MAKPALQLRVSCAFRNCFLGLFDLDANDLDSVVKHARRAYELGYPLLGLTSKLRGRGRFWDKWIIVRSDSSLRIISGLL